MRWPEWKWRAALLAGGWLIGAAACGPGKVALPAPPLGTDVAAVNASYQMPTAVLDTSQIDQTYMTVKARLDQLPVDWLPPLVADVLNALQKRLQASGLPDSPAMKDIPSGAKVTSVLEVKRICNGWNGSSTPDEAADGSITATALVEEGVLQPVAWATAQQCQEQVMPSSASSALNQALTVNGSLDGSLEFYLLGQLPDATNGADALVAFAGTASVGGQTGSASFDMQLSDDFVKFKVSTDSAGDYVVVTLMGATLQIDGANAGFSCDIGSATCAQNR